MIPHAFTVTVLAQQRHAELLTEAERHRVAQGATGDPGNGDLRWPDWRAAAACLMALALPVAAGAAA